MIRLAVSAEGQTEEEFAKRLLAPQLQQCGVLATPILLGRARNQRAGGGDVTLPWLVSEVACLSWSFHAVTTLVDFYGFKGKGQRSADELEEEIRSGVGKTTGGLGDRLVPHVQRHEFEGLLFSDTSAAEILPDSPPQAVQALGDIRSAFETPEDIDDNRQTAPGRRIAGIVNYRPGDGGRKAPNRRVVIGRYGRVGPDKARRKARDMLGQVAGRGPGGRAGGGARCADAGRGLRDLHQGEPEA